MKTETLSQPCWKTLSAENVAEFFEAVADDFRGQEVMEGLAEWGCRNHKRLPRQSAKAVEPATAATRQQRV